MKKKYVNLLLIIITLFLIVSIFRSWFLLQKRSEAIKKTQDKLTNLIDEQERLNRELARVEGREYIEREARNKLNYGKEGESFVFLPEITPVLLPTPTPTEIPYNWLKWVKIFQ
ncbi:hypothetical protein A2Y99_04485 [Candidatus Gottesmanbacteria bacterium RBG_13_37_7]|uniref:Cell division protein FtsL n=1 Tax=Candidatus Gottesmanbacteria bacterium RBG_13_37_7 TaxID=1798369 RepID=A0A1F5YGD5_9BACT|nr:MAG: hypothetical protein A2Y99_04485 [Candidatus Gottesmanbacteria bacterium RBG_13_37_7]